MKYEVIKYDVWGNSTDGYEVNNAFRTNLFINIEGNDTDKDILKKLKEIGFLKNTAKYQCFEIEGELEYSLYIDHISSKNGIYPFCELRALGESHE